MVHDLRMPAAFKALQRNRPPECVLESNESSSVNPPIIKAPQFNGAEYSGDSNDAFDLQQDCGCEVKHPYSSSSSSSFPVHQHVAHKNKLEEPANQDQHSHKVSGKKEGILRKGILSRELTGSTIPQDGVNSGFRWPSNESHTLRFAASAPELLNDNFMEASANHKLLAFASTSSFNGGVDRYGFKKPTTDVADYEFNDWSEHYRKYMMHREEKWIALLKGHGLDVESQGGIPVRFPPESQRLRRYVRKGIPPKWRGNAWFWFARGYDKLNSRPGLYKKYVEETQGLKNSDTEHIERDLHRTFPDNLHYRNDPLTNEESTHLKALRRVLVAFSAYQPKIGYCQSLNFIAGNLLLFMDEERAFWMLVIITQNYLTGLHEVNLEQVNISQGILMISVRDRMPKIWSALNLEQSFEDNFISNLPPISLCTAPWFMSLMVNVLPTETMLRVWDCFFLEGPKTLYRISLTIFKLVEAQLSKAVDELEIFQLIQSAPKKLHDPEVLMKACFKRANGFGHISNEDIALLRSFVQTRRKQSLEGIEQSLNDRNAYAKLHRGRRVRAKLSLYR